MVVRACVNFYFLAIPLFVICWFLLCLYYWKISYFSIVVKVDDIWFLEKYVFVAFVRHLKLISPYEKGWNLNGGQEYKKGIYHSVLADIATLGFLILKS